MIYLNSVFSKVISLPFIFEIVVLAAIVFGTTILIQRVLKRKYINELQLAKLSYKELYETLYSDAYQEVLQLSLQNERIRGEVKRYAIEKDFHTISDVLLGCKAMIELFDEISLSDYEWKEIASVISYINDVIDSQQSNVEKLNTRIQGILLNDQDMDEQKEDVILSPVGLAAKMHEDSISVDNDSLPSMLSSMQKKESFRKRSIGNIGYRPVMMSRINITKRDISNQEVHKMDNRDITLENKDVEEVSVFGKGMRIDGNVNVDSPLIVRGEVKGNITCKQEMEVDDDAIITGDVVAKSMNLRSGKILGELNVTGTMYSESETYIKGNVNADTLVIHGAIEGNIIARSEVSFAAGAKVLGDIRAVYIDIEKGAKISGTMNIGEGVADTSTDKNNHFE